MREPWDITREMFLSEREVKKLLSFLKKQAQQCSADEWKSTVVDKLIIESLLFSGLRNSEFCRLRLNDTIIGLGESAFQVSGTRKQDRIVYVPTSVSRIVEEYAQEIRPEYLPEHIDPDDHSQPLIFNERKRPYERTALYRRVVRVLTTAELGERASVQLLRHTYGYQAYKCSGGNLLFAQRQLGHAHPMVTAVYAQFVEESYAELSESIYKESHEDVRRPHRRRIEKKARATR